MIAQILQKVKDIDQKLYLKLTALAVVLYYGLARLFQDFLYSGPWARRFAEIQNDYFTGYTPLLEPLEIPLYFLGFLVIPITAFLLYGLQKAGYLKYLGLAAVVLLIWKFGGKLGSIDLPNFSFIQNYLTQKGFGKALWLIFTKRIYFLRLAVILSLAVFGFAYYFFREKFVATFRRLEDWPLLTKLEPMLFLLIAFLVFHPNLPYEEHHYNFVIGTVNDMLHGKPFLYETMNQYGILNIYFLAAVFKIFGIGASYEGLSLIISLFYFAFYAGLYYFLKKWLKSQLFAYLGILTVIAVSYFLQVSPSLSANFYPGLTAFRWFMLAPLLLALQTYLQSQSPRALRATIFLTALAIFWNLDSGIYLAIAVFASLWYFLGIRHFWSLSRTFALSVGAIFAVINLGNFSRFGEFPKWGRFLSALTEGAAINPLPSLGFFEVFVFAYLAAALLIGYKFWIGREKFDPLLLFLTIYGAFSFLYYINNSEWNVFYPISTPLILLTFRLARDFLRLRLVFASLAAVLGFVALIFLAKLPVELQNRDYRHLGRLSVPDLGDRDLWADAAAIQNDYSNLKRWPLIHERSTKLLIYGGKTNYFDFYSLGQVPTKPKLNGISRQIAADKPVYLFVGREKNNQIEYLLDRVPADYQLLKSLRTLDIYVPKS